MKRFLKNIDERNRGVILKVCSIMYFITLMALTFVLLYRQFILHQSIEQFTDIANILVFNVIVVIAAVLYLGGITFPRIKPLSVLLIYIAFVSFGFLFTLFKYSILLDQPLTLLFAIEKLALILVICALFMFIYVLFAYLGQKKIESDIS